MSVQELRVKALLLSVFADEFSKTPPLSHHDCLTLRRELITLRDSDIKNCLPQVLLDLLETHTNDYTNSENVEEVVSLLNPVANDKRAQPHPEREEIIINLEPLARRQTELYSLFSVKQAEAIAAWLDLATHWEDLFFHRERVKMALVYWTQKAQLNQS
jgi:hypothetical protein